MLARNSLLARLAASATSFALRDSSLARRHSVTTAPRHIPVIPNIRSANWSLGIVPRGARVIQAAIAMQISTSNTAIVDQGRPRRTAVQITGIKSRYIGWYEAAGANANNTQTIAAIAP